MSAVEVGLEIDRLEPGGSRLPLDGVVIVAGALQQRGSDPLLHPPLKQNRLRCALQLSNAVCLACRALHHVPWIARGFRLVDDQRADGTASRGLFVLVHPAAVEGHRLAAELARHRLAGCRLEVGIVDEHDDDLAAHVDALEIVPAALGRGDSVADEHHWRVGYAHAIHQANRAEIEVVGKSERGRLAALAEGQIRRRLELGVDHRHGLRPAAILSGGLEAGRLELFDEVRDRLFLAGSARRAALEFVGCEDACDLRHALRADMRRRCRRRGHEGQQSGNERNGFHLDASSV